MINKRLLILLIGTLIINVSGFAQPILDWSKNYGGSENDYVRDIEKTADGGYIIAGSSNSVDGDVGGNNGINDAWIVKIDEEGNLEWEQNYGGSESDGVQSIKQTPDGGYIVAANARSNDGDVGGNNGDQDSWVIKLDNEGNLEWEQNYGGSDKEFAVEIIQAADIGYVLLSYSQSNDGDVGGNNGGRDYWIVKLDEDGNLEWEQNYGGSAFDVPSSIKVVTDGGYIISGWAGVNDGDVTENNGSNDSWLVKLDVDGNLEWETSYGGSENDVTYDMDKTIDGGYVLVGRSFSSDGIAGANNGEHDGWIIKLDNEGNLEWGKNYGGSENDAVNSVNQTADGGYILVGDSQSNDGDLGGNSGGQDSWIIKLDSEGNLEWMENYGGSADDLAREVLETANNEYIVANWSESTNGDVVENNGNADIWITKFIEPTPQISISVDSLIYGTTLIGDSTSQTFYIINEGNLPLVILSSSTESGVFSLLNPIMDDFPLTIETGDSLLFDLTFIPNTEGDFLDIITFNSNDEDEPNIIIWLNGIGEMPVAQLETSLDTLDYGSVLEFTDTTLSFYVYNMGNSELVVSDLTIPNEEFTITEPAPENFPFSILPGDSVAVSVQLIPTQDVTNYEESLNISSNDVDEPVVVIWLTGESIFNSIEQLGNGVTLSVFPNPVSNQLSISWSKTIEEGMFIDLISIDGKQQHRLYENNEASGAMNFKYDVSFLPKGKYLLNVQTSSAIKSIPILVF